MSLKIGQNQIEFVEKRGIKFFKPFWAVDKYGNPVKIHYDKNPGKTAHMLASDRYDRVLGQYDLNFIKEERTIHAPILNVREHEQEKGIGQILSLAGLIELWGNNWNKFKLFSLKKTMGFHAKLGFKLDTDDVSYIVEGLNFVKGKAKVNPATASSAEFFLPKVKHYPESLKDDPFILQRGANVISEFMKDITRRGQEKYMPNYMCGSDFKFTDWDFVIEKDYLNKLLEKFNIGFRF